MNEQTLLKRLAGLPRERQPEADLWPGIEARLERAGGRRSWPLVAAAAVVVAALAGIVGIALRTAPPPESAPLQARSGAALVYASGVDLEYSGALRDLGGQLRTWPAGSREIESLRSSLDELVQAGRELRAAIAKNPDSVFLADLLANTQRQQVEVMRVLVMQRQVVSDSTDAELRRDA